MHGKSVLNDFSVPITMNIFGQFYLDFGLFGIIVVAIISGLFLKWLIYKTFQTNGILIRSTLFYLQLFSFVAVTKGNLIYEIADRFFVLFVSIIIFTFLISFFKSMSCGRAVLFTYEK